MGFYLNLERNFNYKSITLDFTIWKILFNWERSQSCLANLACCILIIPVIVLKYYAVKVRHTS